MCFLDLSIQYITHNNMPQEVLPRPSRQHGRPLPQEKNQFMNRSEYPVRGERRSLSCNHFQHPRSSPQSIPTRSRVVCCIWILIHCPSDSTLGPCAPRITALTVSPVDSAPELIVQHLLRLCFPSHCSVIHVSPLRFVYRLRRFAYPSRSLARSHARLAVHACLSHQPLTIHHHHPLSPAQALRLLPPLF